MSEQKSFEQLRQEIRALGGDGWDNVADVDAELRAIRGECSRDCEQLQSALTAARARVEELERENELYRNAIADFKKILGDQ